MTVASDYQRQLNHLASMPGLAHATVERKTLKRILLDTGGQVMAQGRLWEIASKHLGAGIYRIKLKLHSAEKGGHV